MLADARSSTDGGIGAARADRGRARGRAHASPPATLRVSRREGRTSHDSPSARAPSAPVTSAPAGGAPMATTTTESRRRSPRAQPVARAPQETRGGRPPRRSQAPRPHRRRTRSARRDPERMDAAIPARSRARRGRPLAWLPPSGSGSRARTRAPGRRSPRPQDRSSGARFEATELVRVSPGQAPRSGCSRQRRDRRSAS